MFGIEKCFGGPTGWGVIATIDSYTAAKMIVEKLRQDGGKYEVVQMDKLKIPHDKDYIFEKYGAKVDECTE